VGSVTGVALAASVALLTACHNDAAEVTISAAASLQGPLREMSFPHPVVFNFGASGALARQIEQGAPADVFLSAAPGPVDALAARGLLLEGARRDLLHNRIVLIVPLAGGPSGFAALPSAKLIAIGEPASVPAGDYARQALTARGLWDKVQSRLVLAKDVRQVLTYVENGDADAGIVYATDAAQSKKVRVVEAAKIDVVYPVAAIKATRHPAAARAVVDFLAGMQARAVFERHGFTVLP
jgi:molybdate transport system substrate-binding protein